MKNFLFILLAVLIATSACKKGDTGPEGPQGTAGEVGAAGKDGSVILAGTVAPVASDGKVGDYYLDKTASLLYGPKSASGWGTGLSIKGETGAAGTAGTQVLKGTGTPAESLGATGDYYLDTESYLLYGPKALLVLIGQKRWGAGLQLGAPCETYIFTSPYNYINSFSYGQFKIPFTSFNFSIEKSENTLSLVYIKRSSSWHLANGPVGNASVAFNAYYNFSTSENCIYLYMKRTDGADWTNQATLEATTGITKIKIVVVPEGKITTISSIANSHDRVMEALKN